MHTSTIHTAFIRFTGGRSLPCYRYRLTDEHLGLNTCIPHTCIRHRVLPRRCYVDSRFPIRYEFPSVSLPRKGACLLQARNQCAVLAPQEIYGHRESSNNVFRRSCPT
ncbi:hypothetical protein ILYODFUR_036254 [Ilyodon furcidens]|uniref:Uncharacterized protein n=1 Tax=Ilyodon furcidens TaxID=33524 RepID=A0ABV0TDY6_9TELE